MKKTVYFLQKEGTRNFCIGITNQDKVQKVIQGIVKKNPMQVKVISTTTREESEAEQLYQELMKKFATKRIQR